MIPGDRLGRRSPGIFIQRWEIKILADAKLLEVHGLESRWLLKSIEKLEQP